MRAAVFEGAGKPLALLRLDDPDPAEGEVIIRVGRCGICSSDLHMTAGEGWDMPVGTVPGHEFAGEIVAVGRGVERFAIGDRITALPAVGCGDCEGCAHGLTLYCGEMRSAWGGYGEYMRVPVQSALKLPATFSLADGALVEPFAVGRFAVRTVPIAAGDRILVLGAGPIALATIFWARQMGARVVALSRSRRREKLTLEMGAQAFGEGGENEVAEAREALGGAPQVVFEGIGVPGSLTKAIEHVGLLGHVVSMGFCVAPDPLTPAAAAMKGVRMSFPLGYSLRDFEYVADRMLAGTIDPKRIISSVVSLDDLPAMFEALRGPNAETKVHLSP